MKKILEIVVFTLSIICLCISMKQFWDVGIFVDEHNFSPSMIFGGMFGMILEWVRLAFLFIICLLSFVNILQSNKK